MLQSFPARHSRISKFLSQQWHSNPRLSSSMCAVAASFSKHSQGSHVRDTLLPYSLSSTFSFLKFALPSLSSQLMPLRPFHSPVLPLTFHAHKHLHPALDPISQSIYPSSSPHYNGICSHAFQTASAFLQESREPEWERHKSNWPIQLKTTHILAGFVSHGILRLALCEQGKLGREV